MSIIGFILGFVVGTLFGWQILSWLVPIILAKISGM